MDISKVKANGPWILCRVLRPKRENGLEKRGSLFIPDGTMEERTGYTKAVVLSAGAGYWTRDLKLKSKDQEGKNRFISPDLKEGDVIFHRGWLTDINKPSPLDDDHYFVHMRDVEGVFEDEMAG